VCELRNYVNFDQLLLAIFNQKRRCRSSMQNGVTNVIATILSYFIQI